VYKGCFRFCDVAFKQINISLYSEKQLTYLLNELTCMKKLRHPNVVLLLGISIDDMENLIIILEYFEQLTMDQFVKKYKGQIPISTKCEILFDIGKFLTLKVCSEGAQLFPQQHAENYPQRLETREHIYHERPQGQSWRLRVSDYFLN
jgi:serine/threonine protein kinase